MFLFFLIILVEKGQALYQSALIFLYIILVKRNR